MIKNQPSDMPPLLGESAMAQEPKWLLGHFYFAPKEKSHGEAWKKGQRNEGKSPEEGWPQGPSQGRKETQQHQGLVSRSPTAA
jgi:hypothetical protein